jgi:hypothetical protein
VPAGELRLAESVARKAQRLDGVLRRVTGGQLDVRALAFLALAGGALYQLLRGQILAPAATLGWYAAALLVAPAGRPPGEDGRS